MATDNQGRNVRNLINRFLPDVPIDPTKSPTATRNLLVAMKGAIENQQVSIDPPAQPTGVVIAKNSLGNEVRWNRALHAFGYQAWRNTTGNIATALLFRELPGNTNTSFFDPNDQATATRYYWIRGINAKGDPGPFSAMVSGTNFLTDPTSTAMGVDAIASGSNTTALGRSAVASAMNATTVGVSAITASSGGTVSGAFASSGVGSLNTIVGSFSSVTGSGGSHVIIGQGATISTGGSEVVIGVGASAGGDYNVSIGRSVTTGTGTQNVAIGGLATTASGNTDNNVAVGQGATATGGNCTVVGQGSAISGARSTGVGVGNTITHTDVVVVGNSITSTANGQIILGSSTTNFTDIWFGRGTTHTGAAQSSTVHATNGTGSNVAGDHLVLTPGLATGNAATGNVVIYTAPAGGSSSTLQTPAAAVTISPTAMKLTSPLNAVLASAALATNATDGFTYVPTCAGTPSGTPTSYTGTTPIVFDTTGNVFYVYNGGWIGMAAIKSIQTGTISILNGNQIGTTTISSVTTAKSVIHFNGFKTAATAINDAFPILTFASTTSLQAERSGTGSTVDVGFTIVEYR